MHQVHHISNSLILGVTIILASLDQRLRKPSNNSPHSQTIPTMVVGRVRTHTCRFLSALFEKDWCLTF